MDLEAIRKRAENLLYTREDVYALLNEVADEARKACEYEARSDVAEARIAATLALHVAVEDDEGEYCPTCSTAWPCPTVKALKGE